MSTFKEQLQLNTKTPQQVADEKELKEKNYIVSIATKDYSYIKEKLLDRAKSGEYTINGNKRNISYNFDCQYLLKCIDRQFSRNPTGRIRTRSYKQNEKVYYHIGKTKEYDLYLSTIKELASKDDIIISPFFVEIPDPVYPRESKINLPYTYSNDWRTSSHKIKVYLEVSITY